MLWPASRSQRRAVERPSLVLAPSIARMTKYAAAVIRKTSSASGLSKRNISAATAVRATSAPATSPAEWPDQRFTPA